MRSNAGRTLDLRTGMRKKNTLSIRCTPVPVTSFQSEKYDSYITIGSANIQTKTFVYFETKVKVKVKFTLEQATKVQRGSRCIALFFL
jgi:hypothetical protein